MNSDEIKLYEDELYKEDDNNSDKEQEREMEEYLYSKVHYASKVDIVAKKQDENNAETVTKENTEFPDIECSTNWEGILGLKESSKKNTKHIGAVVGEDSESWNIEADLEDGGNHNATKRYYIGEQLPNIYCYNCGQQGHIGKECTEEKKTRICYLCGIEGHPRRGCPNELCFNCLMAGHFAKDCTEKKKKPRFLLRCKRCRFVGHNKEECSEIWRQYHCTVLPGEIVKPSRKERSKANTKIFCYNCASKNHFGEDCSESRYSVRAVYSQFIVNYDACTSIQKSSNRIEKPPEEAEERNKNTSREVEKEVDKKDGEASERKKEIELKKREEEVRRKEREDREKEELEKKKVIEENKKRDEEEAKRKEKEDKEKAEMEKKRREKEADLKKKRESEKKKKREEEEAKNKEKRDKELDKKREKEKKKRDEEEAKKKEKEKKETRKREKEERNRERKREEREQKEKRRREKDEAEEAKKRAKEAEKMKKMKKKDEKEKTRKRRHDEIETTPPPSPGDERKRKKHTPRIELIRNNMWVSDQDLNLPKEEAEFSMKDHLNISNSENEDDDKFRKRASKKRKKSSREKGQEESEYIVVDSIDMSDDVSSHKSDFSEKDCLKNTTSSKKTDKLDERANKKRKKASLEEESEYIAVDSANITSNLSSDKPGFLVEDQLNTSNSGKANHELHDEKPNKKKMNASKEKNKGENEHGAVDPANTTSISTDKSELSHGKKSDMFDEIPNIAAKKVSGEESVCIVADSSNSEEKNEDSVDVLDKTGDISSNPIEIQDETESDDISICAPELSLEQGSSEKESENSQLTSAEEIVIEDLTQDAEVGNDLPTAEVASKSEAQRKEDDRPGTPEQTRELPQVEKKSPRRLAARLDYEALQNLKEILYNDDDDDDVIDDTTPIPDPQVHFEDDDASNYEIDKVGNRDMDDSDSMDGNCSNDSDDNDASDDVSGDEAEDDDVSGDDEDDNANNDVAEVSQNNNNDNIKDLTRYDPHRVYQEHLVAYNLINPPQKFPRHLPAVQSSPAIQSYTNRNQNQNTSFRRPPTTPEPRRIVIDPTIKVEMNYSQFALKGLLTTRQRRKIYQRKIAFMTNELGITKSLPKQEAKILRKQYESQINQFYNQAVEEALRKVNKCPADVATNKNINLYKRALKFQNKMKQREEAQLKAEQEGTSSLRVTRASVKKSKAQKKTPLTNPPKQQNNSQNKQKQQQHTPQNNQPKQRNNSQNKQKQQQHTPQNNQQKQRQKNSQNNQGRPQNNSQNNQRQLQNNFQNNQRQLQNNQRQLQNNSQNNQRQLQNNQRQLQNNSQNNQRQLQNDFQNNQRRLQNNSQNNRQQEQPWWMRMSPFNSQQRQLGQQYTDFGD